jgi:hypothetical protein
VQASTENIVIDGSSLYFPCPNAHTQSLSRRLTLKDVTHAFSFRHTATEIVVLDTTLRGVTVSELCLFVEGRLSRR